MNIELNQELVDKINDLIGLDRNLLQNKENYNEVILNLKNKINTLKDNFIANLPYKYTNDATEFENFCSKIQNLKLKLENLKQDDSKIKSLLCEYQQSNESGRNLNAELKPLVLKAISLKRQYFYIKSLIKLQEFKTQIESYLTQFDKLKEKLNQLNLKSNTISQELAVSLKSTKNELNILSDNLVDCYLKLIDYSNKLRETKCENFKTYLAQLVNYLHERIQIIFIKEVELDLKNLNYPFNTSYSSPTELTKVQSQQEAQNEFILNKDKLESVLKASVKRLLTIQQPSVFIENSKDKKNIVISLLIQPLDKRFKFHFFTNRKTNNLDKPEWYLSQIVQWVKEQHQFINRVIQPIFDQILYLRHESAIILFANGLVNLIKEKLEFDLNSLLKNQVQFSHTIDELISFNSQLTTYLKSTEFQTDNTYSCLHVICENSILFSHWLNLERQVCQKKLDLLFSNLLLSNSINSADESAKSLLLNNEKLLNEIWSCSYGDVDSMKPPNCAESFILMVKAITDRYSSLPYPSKKLRFVHLQLELINDFHLRLCQIIRDEAKTPFSKSYLGALNTVNYIIFILDEWKNSTFFIEMQYYKLKYQQYLKKSDAPEQIDFDDEICKSFDQNCMHTENSKANSTQISCLFEMKGTLFDEILPSYEKVKEDMISTITSNCRWELTSRSKLYKREKWMNMPLFSEYYKATLTQSAADMLISLKNMLHLLKESIAKSVFDSILKKVTIELDKFFYQDLIVSSQFNEGGVFQLDFDLNKYLMPILNEFACDKIKIENYFRSTKESILLLKLKKGSAILLKEVLNKALINELDLNLENSIENKKFTMYNAKNALKEIGIVQLSCEQARDILNLRMDFTELN